jgi:pimeloyl-ACP methyl ester carboxylesterase
MPPASYSTALILATPVLATVHGDEPRPVERRAELSTGVAARWIELGPSDGEVVLFLHGITDTSLSFLPAMRHLARLRPELRLVALDQRGHGGSSLPAGPGCAEAPERCFRPEDLAADALALLEREGIERAHVVGHSMGSVAAQELALGHPERVERIVLIGTSARFAGNPPTESFLRAGLVEGPWRELVLERGLAFPRDAWALTPLELAPELEAWLAGSWVVEPGADPKLLAAILPDTARTPLGSWIGVLRALGAHDNRERLRDLRAPTLVLWPIQDMFFSEEPDQSELRAALAAATARHGTPWWWKRYGRTPATPGGPQTDLGHNLQWAAPHAVARDLAAFLRPDGEPTDELSFLEGDPPRTRTLPTGALLLRSQPAAAPAAR